MVAIIFLLAVQVAVAEQVNQLALLLVPMLVAIKLLVPMQEQLVQVPPVVMAADLAAAAAVFVAV